MRQIPRGYILPSAAYSLQTSTIDSYVSLDDRPRPGDVKVTTADLVARSGVIGRVEVRNSRVAAPPP